MLYYVTGSNIFGQWPYESQIINEFHAITECKQTPVLWRSSRLLQVKWSYNLVEYDGNIYITGCWHSKTNQFHKLQLPSDYSVLKDKLFVGNDCNLILISKNNNLLCIIDLKMEKEIKTINFNIEKPANSAKKLRHDSTISKVILMNDSCLYLTSEGAVYCGILPSYVDTEHCGGRICDIQCGYEHFMVLTDNGSVYTWGNGRRMQLGHGEVNNIDLPTEVEALAGIRITKICSGGWHSLALSEFGDLYAWGWNDTGQLGVKENNDSHESYALPKLIELYDNNGTEIKLNIIDIACGSRHSAILLEDNTVWTTGFNKYGQLGFSEVEFPSISHFKKAFKCNNNCSLMCGPWATVIKQTCDK